MAASLSILILLTHTMSYTSLSANLFIRIFQHANISFWFQMMNRCEEGYYNGCRYSIQTFFLLLFFFGGGGGGGGGGEGVEEDLKVYDIYQPGRKAI